MQGSAVYGACLAVGFVVVQRVAPEPIGWVAVWSFFAVQLGWGAALTWRRTALPFATAAMVTGAVLSCSLAVLAAIGHPYPHLMPESWVLLGGGLVLAPLFLLLESRTNPSKWKHWARHMESKSAWDILTYRHIPEMRTGGA